MRRATVTIRQRDEVAEDGYYREWVHAANLEQDEFGVTLNYESRNPQEATTVFVPWASVVRIDWEFCRCDQCRRMGIAA